MKFQMAPNSVFAVLLRSPWWISFVLVGALCLASAALLPERYVVFGMMGAFPFLVVGVIAAFRQLRALGPDTVSATLQTAAAMSWREFGDALERAYQRQGFTVARLDGQGADLLLSKAGRSSLVACKRWKAANHGTEPLRVLSQATKARDASHSIYVTLADVGEKTRRYAVQNQIDLLYGNALAQLLGVLAGSKKS